MFVSYSNGGEYSLQTIVVVFQHAPPKTGAERVAGQIVNYN